MKFSLLFFALTVACALRGGAVNIAPEGMGLMGATNGGLSSTAYHHNGELSHIRDGNPATRVDNYHSGLPEHLTHGYAGVAWAAPRKDSIKSITVTMAAYADGGWFGSRECPLAGGTLTTAMLRPELSVFLRIEPSVQITRGPNGVGSWQDVASTNDHFASFTGHAIAAQGAGPTLRSFTLTLRERPVGITGIRVIGPMGGAVPSGYIAISEIAVEADPVVDTDNDQMDDAWEAAHGLNVGVNDADTDGDDDDLVTLDEFVWRTDPQVQDSDGDGIFDGLEGGYGTHPNAADTDGDGIADKVEIDTLPTVPTLADTDRDGLSDSGEINIHQTDPVNYDSDGDGFGDGRELALGLNPLSAASRLPNLARAGRGIMGRNFRSSGSPTFLQRNGTPISNGGNATCAGDLSLTTLAHTSGNSDDDGSVSNASHAGILLGERLPAGATITRIEVTFATYGTGGWFGTTGPAPGEALTAAHLIAPELQVTNDGINWGTVPATTDYVSRMTGHIIGTSSVATRRSVVFTLNNPERARGIRVAGRHRNFLAVYEVAVTTSLDAGDADADGLTDADEASRGTSAVYTDTDEDGLSDYAEVTVHHTDPLTADSDGDTFADGHEVHEGNNPLSAGSMPAGVLILTPVPSCAIMGTGIIGTKTAMDTAMGTSVIHAGTAANIVDENPTTSVDSWNGAAFGAYSYVGVSFGGANLQTVATLKVRFATFVNGGWFGPTNTGPAAGGLLTAAHLTEPAVQVRYDNSTNWVVAPHTSDYISAMTGHKIGNGVAGFFNVTVSPAVTFKLDTIASNVNAIRLVGVEGGSAEGFIGVYDLAAFSVAPAVAPSGPDTDGDGLPDAWEIAKFGSITAHDGDDDPDNDGSSTFLEYAFDLSPAAFDAPPSATLEGNYLTLTLTKRPLVNYSVLSGSGLQDFNTVDTVTLINDATTLKVRDSVSITGPSTRRFLRARVTAAP